MIYDLGKFGTILEKQRTRKGYSLSEVQRMTKVDRNTLAKMEYGEIVPTLRSLERLSKCYNSDLISIYSTCRAEFNPYLINIYRRIDEVSSHGEFQGIRDILSDLDNFKNKLDNDKKIKLNSQIEALEIWAEFIRLSDPIYQNGRQTYIYKIIDYFRKTHKGFTINSLNEFNFDYFEMRLLLTICAAWMNTEHKENALMICDFVLERLQNDTNQFDIVVDLITRVYYLKSFLYFFMEDDNKTIEYSTLGIELCISRKYISLLPDLYLRRGVAKILLDEAYENDLILACKTCEVINENEFIEHMIDRLKVKYDISVLDFYQPLTFNKN